MHAHSKARMVHRSAVGVVLTAVLALPLAACSSPGTTPHSSDTQPAAAAATASSPASTAPSPTAADSGLTGKWAGKYSGGYTGTFVLHWQQTGSKLSGTIRLSNLAGSIPIHGRVTGESIQFGTVGSYGITYKGTVSGNSMSGTYRVKDGSSGTWSANKA